MSDANDLGLDPEALSTEATPDGAPAGGEQITEAPEVPRQYFEIDDDVAQRYVKVKIDGEEQEVPLGEMVRGYSREADYTRKTQALAQQRAEAEYALTLQRALQAAPEDTIRLLAERHGLTLAQAQAQAQAQIDEFDDDQFADPLERKLTVLERKLQERDEADQRAAAQRALQSAIGGLQTKYQADDATVREVVQTALQYGSGPETFEMIYKNIAFDRQMQAQAQAQATRQQQEQQRTQAKEQVSQVIGSGGSAASAGAPPPQTTQFKTYREGIEAAFNSHGA